MAVPRFGFTVSNFPEWRLRCTGIFKPFCVGKKNWILINSEKGANASARAYSIAETAKANELKPYKYFEYLLTELPLRMDDNGVIDPESLDDLMPWSESIPEACKKSR